MTRLILRIIEEPRESEEYKHPSEILDHRYYSVKIFLTDRSWVRPWNLSFHKVTTDAHDDSLLRQIIWCIYSNKLLGGGQVPQRSWCRWKNQDTGKKHGAEGLKRFRVTVEFRVCY